LHEVITKVIAMMRAAATISVFMVYRGSLLQGLLSMWLGSLAMLAGMLPMLGGLLVHR
jgi:hypothetical protein